MAKPKKKYSELNKTEISYIKKIRNNKNTRYRCCNIKTTKRESEGFKRQS